MWAVEERRFLLALESTFQNLIPVRLHEYQNESVLLINLGEGRAVQEGPQSFGAERSASFQLALFSAKVVGTMNRQAGLSRLSTAAYAEGFCSMKNDISWRDKRFHKPITLGRF